MSMDVGSFHLLSIQHYILKTSPYVVLIIFIYFIVVLNVILCVQFGKEFPDMRQNRVY